jgi:peptidoglycan hydrolase-like protein with peptidoglycan-binding domain
MKKIQNKKLFGAYLFSLTLALLFTGMIQVQAESPNILVGPDLSIGSSNGNVVVLQGLLSELGYLNIPIGVPLGYYGGITKNAVEKYQSALSVSPTEGYYGGVTKNAMRSHLESEDWLDLLGWN